MSDKLIITYSVQNKNDKVMYFAVGGHPGFNVPFYKDSAFEDYYLEFDSVKEPKKIIFSEDCFVTGREESFPLKEGIRLPLPQEKYCESAEYRCIRTVYMVILCEPSFLVGRLGSGGGTGAGRMDGNGGVAESLIKSFLLIRVHL